MVVLCVAVLAVSGCARSEVGEAQVRARAEEVARLLLSAAEGVPRYQDDIVRSEAVKVETPVRDPWRYWQIDVNVVLAQDSPTSPPEVAAEMIRLLRVDGWTQMDRPDPERGVDETFRKNEEGGVWTVVLTAGDNPAPKPRNIVFHVVSPPVNR